jgi:hypothetical protein
VEVVDVEMRVHQLLPEEVVLVVRVVHISLAEVQLDTN